MQDPDRQLGGAFGTLTLRELYVGLALLGAMSREHMGGRSGGYEASACAERAVDMLGTQVPGGGS